MVPSADGVWRRLCAGWRGRAGASRFIATLLVAALSCCAAPSGSDIEVVGRRHMAATSAAPPWAGVWSIWSSAPDTKDHPYLRGDLITTGWATIEPQKGRFEFGGLDARIKKAVDQGLYVGVKVYHGDKAPDWVYQSGVPKVATSSGRNFPYYLDPDYKPLLSTMIRRVATHLKSEVPAPWRPYIVFVQATAAQSGDPQPYFGEPLNSQHEINAGGSAWDAWTREIIGVYHAAYAGSSIEIVANYGADSVDEKDISWLKANAPGAMVKMSRFAHRYHLNDEKRRLAFYKAHHWPANIHNRGELDREERDNFQDHYAWNIYWSALWNLHTRLDSWNVRTSRPENFANYGGPARLAFDFFNRYAGHRDASNSPGAFIALRDGLDAADKQRFSESVYGPFTVNSWYVAPDTVENHARMAAIAKAFAPFGAKQEDSVNELKTQVGWWLSSTGINDVGFEIHDGNYQLFIEQIDARETSQGYWRQGSDKEPYGRFARGFNVAKGMNALYFDVNDGLLAGPMNLELRLVYLDRGTGTFSLDVYAPNKQSHAVKKQNSGSWKELTISIAAAQLNNAGPRGADLSLVNDDGEDDVFHLLELRKVGDVMPAPDAGAVRDAALLNDAGIPPDAAALVGDFDVPTGDVMAQVEDDALLPAGEGATLGGGCGIGGGGGGGAVVLWGLFLLALARRARRRRAL